MRTLFSLPVATALLILAGCGGGQPDVPPRPQAPAPAPAPSEAPAPAPAAPAAEEEPAKDFDSMSEEEQQAFLMELGERVYMTGEGGLACVTCHMANGEGVTGAFPPLVGQKEHMGDCEHHATLILDGLSGEIVVNGVTYNGVMTPQRDMLDDLKIAAVTSYTRNSWGNDYGFCTPAQVAAARAK